MSKITNKNFNVHKNIYCINCKRRTGAYKRSTKWPVVGIVIGCLFSTFVITGLVVNEVAMWITGLVAMILIITISSIMYSKQKKDDTYKCGLCHSRVTADPSKIRDVDYWEESN